MENQRSWLQHKFHNQSENFIATIIVMWNFCVDNPQGYKKYYMILGCDILAELNIGLCFYNNTIRENGYAYEFCTSSIK